MKLKKVFDDSAIYKSKFQCWTNKILFPFKIIIPQPIISKIPYLTTNEDIRVGLVRLNSRGRLLDIGCGINRLVKDYKSMGNDGLGVDVYDWGSVDLVVKDTATLPFDKNTFDTISFVACLNHIPNREDVLLEAKRLLTSDGQILITNLTPFASRIWHAYAYWDADQHERGMEEGEVYGFTPNDLIGILSKCGLKVVARKKFSWGLNELFICQTA